MPFDGTAMACLRHELSTELNGSRIGRIAQPEENKLLLTLRIPAEHGGGQRKLLLSADASLPLAYLTEDSSPSPLQAPAFCMLLRKHLEGGRILGFSTPGLDRVLEIRVEHRDELGDLKTYRLISEFMGKHSNIILVDADGKILDAIRRISSAMSSLREVLPGREYFLPDNQKRFDPLTVTRDQFMGILSLSGDPARLLSSGLTGFSRLMGEELVHRASTESRSGTELTEREKEDLYAAFLAWRSDVEATRFAPAIYPSAQDFSVLPLSLYGQDPGRRDYESISRLLSDFYSEKSRDLRIRQKTADLRKLVQTHLERAVHKLDLQEKQLKDTDKRDRYKLCGELLNAYSYQVPEGSSECTLSDFYTGEPVKITLDPQKTVAQNAQRYYERYAKLRRTEEALTEQIASTRKEIRELQDILLSLSYSDAEADLAQIRQELYLMGIVKRSAGKGKQPGKPLRSKPLHYLSRDGYHLYVGKNNLQNEEVTFKIAGGSDLWFHANDMPGSHVIAKTEGRTLEELPDSLFEDAASLAAYYSSGREQDRVEIDYLFRRDVKKPGGGAPGFVLYHTNYSMIARPDISRLTELD